jgi:hypothetical protein
MTKNTASEWAFSLHIEKLFFSVNASDKRSSLVYENMNDNEKAVIKISCMVGDDLAAVRLLPFLLLLECFHKSSYGCTLGKGSLL